MLKNKRISITQTPKTSIKENYSNFMESSEEEVMQDEDFDLEGTEEEVETTEIDSLEDLDSTQQEEFDAEFDSLLSDDEDEDFIEEGLTDTIKSGVNKVKDFYKNEISPDSVKKDGKYAKSGYIKLSNNLTEDEEVMIEDEVEDVEDFVDDSVGITDEELETLIASPTTFEDIEKAIIDDIIEDEEEEVSEDEIEEITESLDFEEVEAETEGTYSKVKEEKGAEQVSSGALTKMKQEIFEARKNIKLKNAMLQKAGSSILKLVNESKVSKKEIAKLKFENDKLRRANGIFEAAGDRLNKEVRKAITEKFNKCKNTEEVKSVYEGVVKLIKSKSKPSLNESVKKSTAVKRIVTTNKEVIKESNEQLRKNMLMGIETNADAYNI